MQQSTSLRGLASRIDSIQVLEDPKQLIQPVGLPQSRAAGKACKYCPEAVFDDPAEFRDHYQTEWHIHNQNLSLRSKSPITIGAFEARQLSDSSDSDFWEEQSESEIAESDDDEGKAVEAINPFVKFTDGIATYSIYRQLLFSKRSECRSTPVSTDLLVEFIKAQTSWAIFLFKGGRMFAGIYDLNKGVFTKKRMLKKYTERRKQGGSQMLRDKSGKVAKSAGSQLRRSNEQDLLKETDALIKEWSNDLKACQLIFWNRTFFSQMALFQSPGVLSLSDPRLRKYPFTTYKPSEEEAIRCVKKLSIPNKVA